MAGTWRFTGERVQTTPFTPLAPPARDELAAEAARRTAVLLDDAHGSSPAGPRAPR